MRCHKKDCGFVACGRSQVRSGTHGVLVVEDAVRPHAVSALPNYAVCSSFGDIWGPFHMVPHA